MNLSIVLGFFAILWGNSVTAKSGLSFEVFLRSYNNSNFTTNGFPDLAATYLHQRMIYTYSIRIKLGTPPKTFELVLDSGSSVTWVQHALCLACIDDTDGNPGYWEAHSSTAETVKCDKNEHCTFPNAFCNRDRRLCQYTIRYLNTDSDGIYYSDTLYIDAPEERTDVMERFIFGGGLNIRGIFLPGMDGIFGLGNANGSFLSQKGIKQLSFCLQTFESPWSTELLFGEDARMFGKSTPMINVRGLYAVILKGISVDSHYLDIEASLFRGASGKSGAFVDTGARITVIPSKAYQIVVKKLVSVINLPKLNMKSKVSMYDRLCYMGTTAERDEFVPLMKLHFERSSLPILPQSLFATGNGTMCLNVLPNNHLTIIGSPFLQNVNVGIDLDGSKIFMQPMCCDMI